MASFRALRPMARQAPRLIAKPMATPTSHRFLNTATAPAVATSHATSTGGRAAGHVKSDHLDIKLDMPKSVGGEGKFANPEELFAMGYGACFQQVMNIAADEFGVKLPKDYEIATDVHLVGEMKAVDLCVRVDMKVTAKGVDKGDLDKVIQRARETCPYSRAIQGNVTTNIEAVS